MATARAARPLSTAEAVLVATLGYLVLLISLTGARIARERRGPRSTEVLAVTVTQVQPAAAARAAPAPTCVGPTTVPYSYAAAPGVVEPLAFGPPVEPTGPRSAAAVNGVLIQRLCGGPTTPGGPVRGRTGGCSRRSTRRSTAGDPNRPLSQAQWAAGVNQFIIQDGLFTDARVVTRTVPAGAPTFGMKVVSRTPGVDPVVVRTRMARGDTSRYLLLPVRSARGPVVTLTLRLRCGFQPIL